jgi:subtilisin family serine protease
MIFGASVIAPAGWSSVMTYLEVTPAGDFESSGEIGGPFTPASKDYQIKNTSLVDSVFWGVDVIVSWLDLEPEPGWGLLDPNETVIVTVSLNSVADTLGGGIHTDTITFTDITNEEEETRGVTLTITAPPGELEITPVEDFASSGEPGGPFTPSSKDYQLKNIGGQTLDWGVSKTASWLDLGPETWGDLDPCESTIVTISLNEEADLLGEGEHTDTVTFTDITNLVEYTRDVTLSIVHIGGIWVDPDNFDVEVVEGTTLEENLIIGNDGVEDLSYSIRTRIVSSPSKSSGSMNGILSVPEGHDFTVAGDGIYKPGELIVRFGPRSDGKSASEADKQQIVDSLGGGTIARDFDLVPGLSVVELPEGMTVQEALQRFNNTSGILYAEPNYEIKLLSRIPNDTRFDELWGMHNMGQTGGTVDADIDAPEAWDLATGNSSVIVALLDTGVDYNHIDLAANMWVNSGEIPGNGQDDDGNGYVDDVYGWDFADDDANPMDYHYHGTHCAGTIGGIGNNNEGVAGVCWNVTIMSLKVFPNYGETGFIVGAIAAIEYAVDNGAQLTSNSWGGGPYSQGLKDAITDAGTAGLLFVAAAGNDYGQDNDVYPHYPSSYDCDSIIAVMSTDDEDDMSNFSNYGPASVDLGAPGSDILSCEPGNQYQYLDGTSMATPHVAGACALLWSVNPMLTNTETKEILLETVDPTLGGLCVSQGRLNMYNAILETRAPWLEIDPEEGIVGPGDTNDISVTFDAMALAPGVYEAEIIVTSDDPVRPTITIPVTMMVLADALTDKRGDRSSCLEHIRDTRLARCESI